MARTRTVQRSPDLGLKIRMVKEVVADCCVPEIGPARWYNPATGAYDLETAVIYSDNQNPFLVDQNGDQQTLFAAEVTGNLCDCSVSWSTEYVQTGPGNRPYVQILTPGRGLAVGIDKYGYLVATAACVVTAIATVILRDGTAQTLPPIHLIVVESYYGGEE